MEMTIPLYFLWGNIFKPPVMQSLVSSDGYSENSLPGINFIAYHFHESVA